MNCVYLQPVVLAVPDMTYDVFSGTLNLLSQSVSQF